MIFDDIKDLIRQSEIFKEHLLRSNTDLETREKLEAAYLPLSKKIEDIFERAAIAETDAICDLCDTAWPDGANPCPGCGWEIARKKGGK